MPCKTPLFWYQPRGILSTLLTPVSWLYLAGHNLNQTFKGQAYKSSIPVICIGNAIAGGSGKTPTVMALIPLLKEYGIAKMPYILTRGYGGATTQSTLVDPTRHSAADVGDEALLLCRHAPTIIAVNRAEGAKLAEKLGADLILMDDGLQNHSLQKTLSFLVIDRKLDFGNGKILPAGPLREPLSKILKKINAVICIGPAFHSNKSVFNAEIKSVAAPSPKKNYIAFAGLGLPDKFKNTLLESGINLVGWHTFPDHHVYTNHDLKQLQKEAKAKNARLITTEKDFVRIPENFAKTIETFPITLHFNEPEKISLWIKNFIDQNR